LRRYKCPHCKSRLQGVHKVGHARTESGPHVHSYRGHCEACALPLSRRVRGRREDSGWISTRVAADDLVARLASGDLGSWDSKLSRYPAHRRRWEDFKAIKREADEFWEFADGQSDAAGVCIVRQGMPVADFQFPSPT